MKRGDRVQWIGVIDKPQMGLYNEPHLFRGVVLGVEGPEVIALITDPYICVASHVYLPMINVEKL